MLHHYLHQFGETRLRRIPAEQRPGFCRITQQLLNLARTEILRVNLDQRFAGLHVNTLFIHTFTFPTELNANLLESQSGKLTHGMHLTRSYHKIFRNIMLKDQPHAFHIIPDISPVTVGIPITIYKLSYPKQILEFPLLLVSKSI